MSTPSEQGQELMPDGTWVSAPMPNEEVQTRQSVRRSQLVDSFADTAINPYAEEDLADDEQEQSAQWWRRPIAWIALGVVALLIISAVIITRRPQTTPLVYSTGTVTQGNLTLSVSATGPISSGVYNLNFTTNGTVTAINVKQGQQVKAGDVLATIDPTTLQDAINTAQQQLKSAQASYNSALVSLQNAENSQGTADATAQDAYNAAISPPSGATPTPQQAQQAQDQLNNARTQAQNSVNSAEAQINSANIQIQTAQMSVTTAQHNLSGATLTAPVDGDIATITGNVGASSGGSSSSTAFMQLVNLSTMNVTGLVNEADIGSVNTGWPVTFTVQAFPQDTFVGTVAAISPIGQTTQNVVSYPVTIAIDAKSASQARLFPGMTASLTITTKQAIGALLVPNTAISYARTAVRNKHLTTAAVQTAVAAAQQMIASDDTLKGGTAGYVTEYKGGKLVAIPVVTSITDSTSTVVLVGLNENDVVITGDNQATTTTSTSTSGTNIFGGGRSTGGGRGAGG